LRVAEAMEGFLIAAERMVIDRHDMLLGGRDLRGGVRGFVRVSYLGFTLRGSWL
jgi:hypothetical protein